ncbi:replicative DNA helicase [Paenibacillus agilis]|uniref:Replicative DNA helicase n=1 Tax=Paenibacillus agilis TaxID=3020863 RepID=A0A559IZH3_9BACL|nr:replicative DNA helicase [Paenibacillus agilis]TVX93022.1 replicative DNA helicase [Paenibacillus agilis]
MDNVFGIELPIDLAAEQAILGSLLLDTELVDTVREKLRGEEFDNKSHVTIFKRMCEMASDEEPIDIVTLSDKLNQHNEIEKIGGVSYLSRLAGSVPSTANLDQYVDIVKNKYLLRESMKQSMALIQQAAASNDPTEVITKLQLTANRLSDIAAPTQDFKKILNVVVDVYEETEKRYENREVNQGITGLASGFVDLDKMTSGFQKSDLIIVAARPSVGKTAFALNVAQNVGIRSKAPVAIFSLEMSAAQLVQRMICAESMVDANRMRTGYLEDSDWTNLTTGIGILGETNIFIDDTAGINVYDIRSKCRRLKKEHGLGMIVIDYLQLISGRGKAGENRQQEVSEISRLLKQLARELEVPVIALSQLSRGVEQRQDKRPMMSDLRESGSIEQDADIVAFLYRDDYYDKESDKKNIIEIIIAKQRNGAVGTVELAFLKNFNKFANIDRKHQEQIAPPEEKQPPKQSRPPWNGGNRFNKNNRRRKDEDE